MVLNWNGARVVGDCVRSLLAQDYPALQVLVVDLVARRVVWEKRIVFGASSTFFKEMALHEIEEGLGRTLVSALASRD